MSSVTTKRVSLTIPIDVLAEIDYCAGRLGITRSAFMCEITSTGINSLSTLLRSLPESPTDSSIKRFRGDSVAVIQELVRAAMSELDSLGGDDEQRDMFKD